MKQLLHLFYAHTFQYLFFVLLAIGCSISIEVKLVCWLVWECCLLRKACKKYNFNA